MKKIFLITLAIAFLFITSYSQRKQIDLKFEGLKGKVKSVQNSSMYLGTKDEPEKSPERTYSSTKFYDLDGNITEELHPDLGIKYVYQFVDGFLSMKEVVVDKKKAATIGRTQSIGNAEDMEKPVKTIKPDERFTIRYDDEYDDKKRLKLRRLFFSDGQMNSINLFSYNSAGLLENEVHKSYGDKWSYIYSYDKNGNLNERTMKRSDVNDVVDRTDRTIYGNYKFDAQGNWIERKQTSYNEYATSEKIYYRDIKYHDADKPKQKPTGKAGN